MGIYKGVHRLDAEVRFYADTASRNAENTVRWKQGDWSVIGSPGSYQLHMYTEANQAIAGVSVDSDWTFEEGVENVTVPPWSDVDFVQYEPVQFNGVLYISNQAISRSNLVPNTYTYSPIVASNVNTSGDDVTITLTDPLQDLTDEQITSVSLSQGGGSVMLNEDSQSVTNNVLTLSFSPGTAAGVESIIEGADSLIINYNTGTARNNPTVDTTLWTSIGGGGMGPGTQGPQGPQGIGIFTVSGSTNPTPGQNTVITVNLTDPTGNTTPSPQTFIIPPGAQGTSIQPFDDTSVANQYISEIDVDASGNVSLTRETLPEVETLIPEWSDIDYSENEPVRFNDIIYSATQNISMGTQSGEYRDDSVSSGDITVNGADVVITLNNPSDTIPNLTEEQIDFVGTDPNVMGFSPSPLNYIDASVTNNVLTLTFSTAAIASTIASNPIGTRQNIIIRYTTGTLRSNPLVDVINWRALSHLTEISTWINRSYVVDEPVRFNNAIYVANQAISMGGTSTVTYFDNTVPPSDVTVVGNVVQVVLTDPIPDLTTAEITNVATESSVPDVYQSVGGTPSITGNVLSLEEPNRTLRDGIVSRLNSRQNIRIRYNVTTVRNNPTIDTTLWDAIGGVAVESGAALFVTETNGYSPTDVMTTATGFEQDALSFGPTPNYLLFNSDGSGLVYSKNLNDPTGDNIIHTITF